jgi:elongation factor 1-beta
LLYQNSFAASEEDVKVYHQLGNNVDATEYPHISRWYFHISALLARNAVALAPNAALTSDSKGQAASPAPAADTKKAAAPAKDASDSDSDDDDDFEMEFSDDEDDGDMEEMLAKKREEAIKNAQKDLGKGAKSSVVFDVKPFEAETDMGELEASVRGIDKEGLNWGGSELKPVAFGVKKLRIMCTVRDDLVGVDDLLEEIEDIEDCQSCEIFAFNKV